MAQAPHPRMHGLTHLQGGADPIPDRGSTFDVHSYRDLVLATPNLWGLWPMDDAAGSATFHNIVDPAAPLTAHSYSPSPLTFDQPGPFTTGTEESVLFQGGTANVITNTGCFGYIGVPAGTNNPFTVEAWVYPHAVVFGPVYPDPGTIVSIATSGRSSFPFLVEMGSGSAPNLAGTRYPNATGWTGYNFFWDGWHHLAATYDGTTMRLYADGSQVGTCAGTATVASMGELIFGGNPYGSAGPTSHYLNGRLSLCAYYTAALDAATVAEHAGSTSGVSGSADADTGSVQTADGAGGTSWQYPTIAVTY